jgi:hypothetical protein
LAKGFQPVHRIAGLALLSYLRLSAFIGGSLFLNLARNLSALPANFSANNC